ncbi:MAG: tetratricopeptide repeat protein [Termitinemataceae bacterium]|nr:MAG: tetratricopeptide repeat protein [Termitinemataceae bacterium]
MAETLFDDNFFSLEAPVNQSQQIADLSKKGYQLLKENKIEEAKKCFGEILQNDTENNYALVGIGDAERKQNSYHEAINYYKRCLEHHPGNNYALFGLGDCFKALNQYNKAIEIWEKYLNYDVNNITVLTRLADAYRKLRDFKHSKEAYKKVLEMESNNSYAIIGLGHLHYDFKEYSDALFFWEKMLERYNIANIDIRVLTSIGNCHRKIKTFENGIKYFEAALAREDNNFYALFGLADCYRGLNRPKDALKYWNLILKKCPMNKVILTRAGDAYCNLKEYKMAEEYYLKALNIEFDIYAVLGMAVIAKISGKYEDAIKSLNNLIVQDPKNHRLYIELAECWIKLNNNEKAIEALKDFKRFGIRNNTVNKMFENLTLGQPL